MKKLRLDELGRLSLQEYKEKVKFPITIVLDNIRSGLNVGSIFRTVDAFAFERIILCGITAKPPHREILKTAIGATESVSWEYEEYIEQCIINLRNEGYVIVIVEQTDESIYLEDFNIHKEYKYAIVFGNEVNGISNPIINKVDDAIEIPQFGTKHSLNVTVCAGIVLWTFWEFFMKKN